MKVIGVGYPRTGTKTLGECFRQLGYRNATWDKEIYRLYENNRIEEILDHAGGFDSFEDLPWCYLYKELDRKFAGSRFILTVRKNESDWFDSLRKHDVYIDSDNFLSRRGRDYETALATYRTHNAGVREFFSGRSDLLEVCWENGDAWDRLAAFLDRPVPEIPFPHKNKTPLKSTFRLYRIYLRSLLSEPEKLRDQEEVALTLSELLEWLPSLPGEQQEELLTLLDRLPSASYSSSAVSQAIEKRAGAKAANEHKLREK